MVFVLFQLALLLLVVVVLLQINVLQGCVNRMFVLFNLLVLVVLLQANVLRVYVNLGFVFRPQLQPQLQLRLRRQRLLHNLRRNLPMARSCREHSLIRLFPRRQAP